MANVTHTNTDTSSPYDSATCTELPTTKRRRVETSEGTPIVLAQAHMVTEDAFDQLIMDEYLKLPAYRRILHPYAHLIHKGQCKVDWRI